ncbi:MAG: hypothetical protein ABJA66_20000 [Actinomycetota bacterium]
MNKTIKKLLLSSIMSLFLTGFVCSQNKVALIEISIKHNEDRNELLTKNQLQRLIKLYDVSKWIFTKKVMIDREAIPHSHPILTLHTRHLKDDELLLSTFVHEQMHWFFVQKNKETFEAVKDLKELFPKVPIGFPGGGDEESTYTHLLVCYSEYQADKELFGELKARQIMEFWSTDHYTWIYQQVLGKEREIGSVIRKYNLKN